MVSPTAFQPREALQPLPEGRLRALTAALRNSGLTLRSGQRRAGELRLELASVAGVVTVSLSPPRPDYPALLRTDSWDFGYLGEGPDMVSAARGLITLLVRAATRPEVARHLQGALAGTESTDAPAETADAVAFLAGEPVAFDPQSCSRRAEVGPRQTGTAGLWLQTGPGQYRPVSGRRGALSEPADAEISARVQGLALDYQACDRQWRTLRLEPACASCTVRTDCAGCWRSDGPAPDPEAQLDEALRDLAWTGAVEILGTEASAALQGRRAEGAALLVLSAADLLDRPARLVVARRLRTLPAVAGVLTLGREPGALVADGPDLAPPLRPVRAALLARSLLDSALTVRDGRWPNRTGRLHWWLLAAPRTAALSSPDQTTSPPERVEHVTLVLNRRCVTVCRYCDLPLRLREDMPIERVWRVLEEVVALGAKSLEFFGGEVTLRPDLLVLLEHGRILGLQTYVTTTGVGLSEEQLGQLARAGITDLSVSIDSADPAVHDDLKGRQGMHTAAVRAATRLRELGAPHVGLNTVITPPNLRGLPEVVRLCAELGLVGVTMFLCQPVAEFGNATPLLDEAESLALITEILPACRALGAELGVHVGVRPAIDREPGDPAVIARRIASGQYSRIFDGSAPCRIPGHLVSVRADGGVRLCNQPVMQFEDSMVVGDLREASLLEILGSPRVAEFRRQAGTLDLCQYCTFDHSVGGADPGLHVQAAGEGAADRGPEGAS